MSRSLLPVLGLVLVSACGTTPASTPSDGGADAPIDTGGGDAASFDAVAADYDFQPCQGPALARSEALTRLGSMDRLDLGSFPVSHRVRTCAAPGDCGPWTDTASPVPMLGIVQGSGYPRHPLSTKLPIALVKDGNGAQVVFPLTVTPDPLDLPGREWASIRCELAPLAPVCRLVGGVTVDALWLEEEGWKANAAWSLPETGMSGSFHATANCARLRLVLKLGQDEHALIFAGAF